MGLLVKEVGIEFKDADFEFNHVSVLYEETILGLNIKSSGLYADLTLGGAGHSSGILSKLNSGFLIGLDQDVDALKVSEIRLKQIGSNFKIIKSNFSDIKNVLAENDFGLLDGVLMDLGVSSYQFDNPARGFSYRFDARLDMRMDTSKNLDAHYIVNNYSEEELSKILYKNADERWATRISKFIVDERKKSSINTTFDLVEVIKKAIPLKARKDGGHPAKKTFQALRIEVNNEIGILEKTIDDIVSVLNEKGRLAVITFHSIEDRVVKNKFKELSNPCTCPKSFPICNCGKKSTINIITRKPILPSDKEIEINKRSKSAKLRIIEKL
ncbi:MAG: 16S rRNA (cytosine(1402)-N(4))-methyltransferase [Clostridiales bacterium]|nr:MAG: 16S rRNA (cytosine(1402)-N(4))-methyltransferase [Clostridiales bacterium]